MKMKKNNEGDKPKILFNLGFKGRKIFGINRERERRKEGGLGSC